jgi:pimeloyl-ACP methyl ester carboxylesterase
MATYVLVHGAWHGGWCWHRVVAHLERAGHRVLAPDLAGLGRDRTAIETVSLASWADALHGLIDALPEPVVLVGHSRGGILLSELAERCPDRIRVLVYVTAYLLEDGQSLLDFHDPNGESPVGPNLLVAADNKSITIRAEIIRETYYNECSDEDVVLALSLLVPEPMAPLATPVHISPANFGRVPRVYIECARDRALSPAAQRRMQHWLPCRERITLDADHSPFLSRPDELSAALLRLADRA